MKKKYLMSSILIILATIIVIMTASILLSEKTAVAQNDFKDIIEKAENYTFDFNFLLDEADKELELYREIGNSTYLEIAKSDIYVAMLVQLEYHKWYTYNLSKNETLEPIDQYLWNDVYHNEDRLQSYLYLFMNSIEFR